MILSPSSSMVFGLRGIKEPFDQDLDDVEDLKKAVWSLQQRIQQREQFNRSKGD